MDAAERIEAWLNNGSPEAYHLVEDAQDLSKTADPTGIYDFRNIRNPYQKFFMYKYYKNDGKPWPQWDMVAGKGLYREIGCYSLNDPDCFSPLLQAVYRTLWPELVARSFMRYKDRIASDAMTSALTRLTDALGQSFSDAAVPEHADPVMTARIRELFGKCQMLTPKQKWWTRFFFILVTADLSEIGLESKFYRMIDREYPAMAGFLTNCFTIGNYCPVPAGFNAPRSGGYGCYDYWDLTLMKIRQWYCHDSGPESDRVLLKEQLLHNHREGSLENCRAWLSWFEGEGALPGKDGWRSFVDSLFLQDYVDEDYKVKPFWEGHSWENFDLPEDRDRINQGLAEISIRIASRAIRMVNACRGRL